MNCSKCGTELTEGAAFCPSCGASTASEATTPAPSQPTASSSGTAAGVPAYKFDAKHLSTTDRIVGVAALVLFISLFLSWFGVGPYSASGLDAHGYLYIVLIIALVEIFYLAARAGWEQVRSKVPVPHGQLLIGANLLNLVLVIIGFFDKPGGYGISGVGWRFGAILALVAAVVAAAPRIVTEILDRRAKAS